MLNLRCSLVLAVVCSGIFATSPASELTRARAAACRRALALAHELAEDPIQESTIIIRLPEHSLLSVRQTKRRFKIEIASARGRSEIYDLGVFLLARDGHFQSQKHWQTLRPAEGYTRLPPNSYYVLGESYPGGSYEFDLSIVTPVEGGGFLNTRFFINRHGAANRQTWWSQNPPGRNEQMDHRVARSENRLREWAPLLQLLDLELADLFEVGRHHPELHSIVDPVTYQDRLAFLAILDLRLERAVELTWKWIEEQRLDRTTAIEMILQGEDEDRTPLEHLEQFYQLVRMVEVLEQTEFSRQAKEFRKEWVRRIQSN